MEDQPPILKESRKWLREIQKAAPNLPAVGPALRQELVTARNHRESKTFRS